LVHLHFGLVDSVYASMSEQPGSSNHVRRHSVSDEHNDVLCSSSLW